ncbi:MAG: hypothetical protein FJ206_14370 [Gemmatimonadetes bacterium]|nr:hypothetical protein [Gemmatimonadota bacterium]
MHPATRSTRGIGLAFTLSAIIGAGVLFTTPVAAQVNLDQSGTPNDGVICRSGYTGTLSNGAFICAKNTGAALNLQCRSQFPNYVVRAVNSSGTPDGRDLCTRAAISLGSTDPLGGLVQGTDYIRADVSQSAVDSAVAAVESAEVAALALTDADVDVANQAPTIDTNATGSRDKARVAIKLYTFAAPRQLALSLRR